MIASTFFRSGMIESWGRGIEKIKNTCREAGKPDPEFEFKYNREFSVTFYSDANITTNNTIKDTIKDTINFEANDMQSAILKLMKANPRITAKAISDELGINERNVKNNIKTLKDAGIIERAGAKKNGQWTVNA